MYIYINHIIYTYSDLSSIFFKNTNVTNDCVQMQSFPEFCFPARYEENWHRISKVKKWKLLNMLPPGSTFLGVKKVTFPRVKSRYLHWGDLFRSLGRSWWKFRTAAVSQFGPSSYIGLACWSNSCAEQSAVLATNCWALERMEWCSRHICEC